MAVNYMDFLRNMGMGSRGASGFYSNMNRSMPGFGNAMKTSQKAGGAKFAASGLNALSQGNTKEAVKSGIGYALNQNPYIAGINMFNDITGGIRFDKMLGMGPKQPSYADKTGQRKNELDYQQAMSDDRNRYLQESARYNDEAARARGYVDDQRAILRDMQERGPSARSLAPMLGQFANLNESAAGAARSNTAANLSRRGIGAGSGLGVGAQSAVDTALAAQSGQQRAGVMNQVMQDTAQLRNAMIGVDASAADKAAGRGIDLMDSAAMLPIRQAMLAQEERKLQQSRDQQMYMRRQGETEALGGFVGKMFPYIYDEYRRGVGGRSDGTGSDYTAPNLTEDMQYQNVGGMDTYVDQFGVRRFFDTDEEVYPSTGFGGGPDEPYNYDIGTPNESPRPPVSVVDRSGILNYSDSNYPTLGEDPELMAQQQRQFNNTKQNYPQQYTTPVEFQTGFALDTTYPDDTIGRIRTFRGKSFMKTPMGWMKR
jgi:hypothetical protein